MASGCAVLCGMNREFMRVPEECPAIGIEPDSEQIYRTLRELLDQRERIYEAAEQGRKYVEKYHDSGRVTEDLIRLIRERPENELIQPSSLI